MYYMLYIHYRVINYFLKGQCMYIPLVLVKEKYISFEPAV